MRFEIPHIGVTSDNAAAAYRESLDNVRWSLQQALEALDKLGNPLLCQKELDRANAAMSEASKWFSISNNQSRRISALVAEVTAMRNGCAMSYVIGNDPTQEDWSPAPESHKESQR